MSKLGTPTGRKQEAQLGAELGGNFAGYFARVRDFRRVEGYGRNARMAASPEAFRQRREILFCGARIPGV